MVINMNETRLCTIEQIERFLSASDPIEFSASGDDMERYGCRRVCCPRDWR
jgi:hypothetical protein